MPLLKYQQISLLVEGQCVKIDGVSKYTTCADVIKIVLKKFFNKDRCDVTSYVIVELSRVTEKLLRGKKRLLKVIRSWNLSSDYRLELRKIQSKERDPDTHATEQRDSQQQKSGDTSKKTSYCSNRHVCQNKCQCIKAHLVKNEEMIEKRNLYKTVNRTRCMENIQEMKRQRDKSGHTFPSKGRHDIAATRKTPPSSIYRFNQVPSVLMQSPPIYYNYQEQSVLIQSPPIYPSDDLNSCRNITGQSDGSSGLIYSQNVSMVSRMKEMRYAVKRNLKSKPVPKCITPARQFNRSNVFKQKALPDNVEKSLKHRTVVCHLSDANEIIKSEIGKFREQEGKEAILQRYFESYILHHSHEQSSMYRGRGDGEEFDSNNEHSRRGDGSENMTALTNESFDNLNIAKIAEDISYKDASLTDGSIDNRNFAVMEEDVTVDKGNSSDTVTSDSGHDENEFDVAFIDEHLELENENPCHTQLVDYSMTESDISEIENDNQHNTSRFSEISDFIRDIFNDNMAEDEEMESFMNSKLSDDISDEGLSSLGSDDVPAI